MTVDASPVFARAAKPPGRIELAAEYMALAQAHGGGPADVSCARFHIRRMCRDSLTSLGLGGHLDACSSLAQLSALVRRCQAEQSGGAVSAADADVIAGLGRWAECGKRNAARRTEYEGRLARKAKREGKPADFFTSVARIGPAHRCGRGAAAGHGRGGEAALVGRALRPALPRLARGGPLRARGGAAGLRLPARTWLPRRMRRRRRAARRPAGCWRRRRRHRRSVSSMSISSISDLCSPINAVAASGRRASVEQKTNELCAFDSVQSDGG